MFIKRNNIFSIKYAYLLLKYFLLNSQGQKKRFSSQSKVSLNHLSSFFFVDFRLAN